MKLGILSVQGAFLEHELSLKRSSKRLDFKADIYRVKSSQDISNLDGFVIPGGESSTISRLIEKFEMSQIIKEKADQGMPIMGTCAGSILMASEGDEAVQKSNTSLLSLMNTSVKRNAFGRQRYSFECGVDIKGICQNFPAVFIRAPAMAECRDNCKSLAQVDGTTIAAEQDNLISLVFHPELTEDLRIHEYFLEKVRDYL